MNNYWFPWDVKNPSTPPIHHHHRSFNCLLKGRNPTMDVVYTLDGVLSFATIFNDFAERNGTNLNHFIYIHQNIEIKEAFCCNYYAMSGLFQNEINEIQLIQIAYPSEDDEDNEDNGDNGDNKDDYNDNNDDDDDEDDEYEYDQTQLDRINFLWFDPGTLRNFQTFLSQKQLILNNNARNRIIDQYKAETVKATKQRIKESTSLLNHDASDLNILKQNIVKLETTKQFSFSTKNKDKNKNRIRELQNVCNALLNTINNIEFEEDPVMDLGQIIEVNEIMNDELDAMFKTIHESSQSVGYTPWSSTEIDILKQYKNAKKYKTALITLYSKKYNRSLSGVIKKMKIL